MENAKTGTMGNAKWQKRLEIWEISKEIWRGGERSKDSHVWRHSDIVVASLNNLLQSGQVMHAAIVSLLTLTTWFGMVNLQMPKPLFLLLHSHSPRIHPNQVHAIWYHHGCTTKNLRTHYSVGIITSIINLRYTETVWGKGTTKRRIKNIKEGA